jgi:hypothetical protein
MCTAYSDVDPRDFGGMVPPEEKLSYLQKPFHPHEIRQMTISLASKWRSEHRIVKLAYFDALTGLPNREQSQNRLNSALAAARQKQRMLAVLYLDLDNFEIVDRLAGRHGGRIARPVDPQDQQCADHAQTARNHRRDGVSTQRAAQHACAQSGECGAQLMAGDHPTKYHGCVSGAEDIGGDAHGGGNRCDPIESVKQAEYGQPDSVVPNKSHTPITASMPAPRTSDSP